MTKRTRLNQSDLKFYPSERLEDTSEGGGLALGTPIQGKAGEIFSPISTLSRTIGDFATRLVYAGVQKDDDEPLIGSFVALTKPPADPATSYLLFNAKFGELRKDGVKRMENYNAAAIENTMTLLSNPAVGSKIIQAYQRTGEKLPSVGDVYCLHQNKRGYTELTQYVQVVKVESSERTFTDSSGDFTRTVIKLEISQPINHDFIGMDYPVRGYADAPTKIRETHVADASSYFGIKPLAKAVKKGEMSVTVPSLFEKIIPTSQVETVIADETASPFTPMLFDGSHDTLTLAVHGSHDRVNILPCVANTLSMGDITDQNGKLIQNGTQIGTVDYITGLLKFDTPTYISTVRFRPAVVITPFADTYRIDIDIKNRSYNHIITLPNVGAVKVSYMAQGKWYTLTDNGSGVLVGESAEHGTGTVGYRTGTVSVTCGQMPDVGSAIIFAVANHATATKVDDITAHYTYRLSETPNLDSLTIDGIKIDKAGNFRHGYIKDNVIYSTAKVNQVRYNTGERQNINIPAPSLGSDNTYHLNLSDTAVAGVELLFAITQNQGKTNEKAHLIRLYDDGAGNLKDSSGEIAGSIDYANATAKINYAQKVYERTPTYRTETYTVRKGGRLFGPKYVTHTRQVFNGWGSKAVGVPFNADIVQCSFYDDTSGTAETENFTEHKVSVTTSAVMGVAFALGNQYYYVKDGFVHTTSHVKVGTLGSFTHETTNGTLTARLISGAKTHNSQTIDEVSFRTPVAPIRLSSVQVRATLIDGTQVSAVADSDGNLDSEWITGKVDAKFGLVTVSFGKMVDGTPTGDETAENGQVWQPASVIADSVVYNAIGISHLPINATHIQIDTVRLPTDGQVPIFRRGDTVLIGNRQTMSIGSAFTGGQTVQLPRQNLDRICVMDNTGKAVNAELWAYDLKAGTITWATPLDLSGYELPIKVMHVIEEKNQVADVDINGTLTLRFATKHDYDVGDTYVSSVLIGGNLDVRHSVPFSQKNWDNQWSDERVGEPILNKLNLKDYPMFLTDDGAITERWAIVFTSSTQFELYGETLGFVAKTDTLQDLAPINPSTNKPYFTIPRQAFGTDATWATRNLVRFNTDGSLIPFWIIRAVQPTNEHFDGEDGFTMCLFGDTTEV